MTCNDVVGVENGAGSGRCCSGQCLCLLDRVRSVLVFIKKRFPSSFRFKSLFSACFK